MKMMKAMPKKAAAKKPASKNNAMVKLAKVELRDERKEMEDERKFKAQMDMETVMRAQEIMADRSRMSMVKKLAAKQAQMANKIAGK